MTSHGPTYNRERITMEAAEWLIRAGDPEMTAVDHKALADWLSGSAEHVREYLQVASLSMDIADLNQMENASTVEELIKLAQSTADETNVVHFDRQPAQTQQSVSEKSKSVYWRSSPIWSVVAMVFVIISSVFMYQTYFSPTVYYTGLGKQASFKLEDGSVVTLNAKSRIEVDYTNARRSVHLIEGEALFEVAKNHKRPFVVVTNQARIQAIGTAFNVRGRNLDTVVTVAEGIVEVSQQDESRPLAHKNVVRVTIGQQAKAVGVEPIKVRQVDVRKIMLWRERRLSFDERTLSEVVAEFNRYNVNQMKVKGNGVGAIKISGTFGLDDPKSFLKFLELSGLADHKPLSNGTIELSEQK